MADSKQEPNPFELIESIMQQAGGLGYQDSAALDALTRRAEMVIRNIFGQDSKYLADLGNISYYPGFAPCSEDYQQKCWKDGQQSVINLAKTMQEELRLFSNSSNKKGKKFDVAQN